MMQHNLAEREREREREREEVKCAPGFEWGGRGAEIRFITVPSAPPIYLVFVGSVYVDW